MTFSKYPQNGGYSEKKKVQSMWEDVRAGKTNADNLLLRVRDGVCADAEAEKGAKGKKGFSGK
jgi:hypothetical protein